MRTRMSIAVFVLGLLVVGASAAGIGGTWSTHLDGGSEVPPNMSPAQGQAILKLSADRSELDYRLIDANIENVLQAHIHLAPPGANGPIVAWLYPSGPPAQLIPGRSDGVLATGTITAASLVGPLAGQPLSELVESLNEGGAYVNVHTSQLPGGEVRGNIR